MDLRSVLGTRKYLGRIFLWITLGMLVVVLVFAMFSYSYVRGVLESNQRAEDRKHLDQIRFNIDYMGEMMQSLCFMTYYNSGTRNLITDDNIEFEDALKQIMDIRTSIVNTNPYIHSVYIYNTRIKKYYTTMDEVIFDDPQLNALIVSLKEIPKMVPLYRRLCINEKQGAYADVLSYFIYEFTDEQGRPDGAVIINSKVQWLLNNIGNLNMPGGKNEGIYILDSKGDFVGSQADVNFSDHLKRAYMKHFGDMGKKGTGSFITRLNGMDYFISYVQSNRSQWTLLKTQPVQQVFHSLDSLRNAFILMTLVFVLVALATAVSVSRSIYNPIGRLVGQVRSRNPGLGDASLQDEISYLHEVYNDSMEKLEEYKHQKQSDRFIMKTYFLRRLLLDSYAVTQEEWERMEREKLLSASWKKSIAVCVLSLDDYRDFTRKYEEGDRGLYRFAAANIAGELLSAWFPNESVDMKGDQIVFLLDVNCPQAEFAGKASGLIKQAQEAVWQYYGIGLSAAVSSCADSILEFSRLYNEAVGYLAYKFVYGRRSIITQNELAQNLNSTDASRGSTLERKLLQEIKIGNAESIEHTLAAWVNDVSRLSYNQMILSVIQLIHSVKGALEEVNSQKQEPVYVDAVLPANEIFETETLEDLMGKVLAMIKAVTSRSGSVENEKYVALAEAVKEMIHAYYFDSGLYLPEIASRLNLSPKHVARVFKSVTKMSVTDYLSDVRLKKAVEWLESSRLSIHEILPKIGISNESYFYKLFKSKYGVTPREYSANISSRRN